MSVHAIPETCGCCEGIARSKPVAIANRPGLGALAWRVGTHARFKQSLLAALAGQPLLRPLTTRDDDDPTIALLDAWAASLDVLTFYQERIANENYLRTSTELRSILELARAIGYELAPGVSASTLLAFTLETAPGAPLAARIAAGTKAQSIPGQDEQPQLYETSADLNARAAWNSLAARTRGPKTPKLGDEVIHLEGLSTGLQPGDGLLLVGDERKDDAGNENWDFRRVQGVRLVGNDADASRNYTEITLDRNLGDKDRNVGPAQKKVRVWAMRQRAALFGYNAPDWRMLPAVTREQIVAGGTDLKTHPNWPGFTIGYTDTKPASLTTLYLDAAYKTAVAGAWAVVTADNVEGGKSYDELYRITKAEESAKADFAVTGKSSKLTLSGENLVEKFWGKLREVAVFLPTDEFKLVERPLTTDVAKGDAALDLAVQLTGDDVPLVGRLLLITGLDAATGETAAESVTLKKSTTTGGGAERTVTRLEFDSALKRSYRRESVRVLANVASATHGETKVLGTPGLIGLPNASAGSANASPVRTEVLGSGDGSLAFQEFVLKQKPITHVGSDDPSGRKTTLEIRVDDVLWNEAPSLFGRGPGERVYVTRLADDGTVTVKFGDGRTGARLPTGAENVTAKYRVGSGRAGLVKAGQISLLLSRPLGLKEVTNPLPSADAKDAEKLNDARRNAPYTVLTLDRVVSLQDYEDFARRFAGIGKAAATLLWTGEHQSVHLTLGTDDGKPIQAPSKLIENLSAALDKQRHPLRAVIAQSFTARPFGLTAKIGVEASRDPKQVLANVRSALAAAYSFDARSFGQAVTVSEVESVIQAVPGVVFVDLDELRFVPGATATDDRLPARSARADASGLHAAELLTLSPADVHLTPVAP